MAQRHASSPEVGADRGVDFPGLEVVPAGYPGIDPADKYHVLADHTSPQVVKPSDLEAVNWQESGDCHPADEEKGGKAVGNGSRSKREVLGLSGRKMWILLGAVLFMIAGGFGGGVAGSLSAGSNGSSGRYVCIRES